MKAETDAALLAICAVTGWTPAQARREALWLLHATTHGRTKYTPCADKTPPPRPRSR